MNKSMPDADSSWFGTTDHKFSAWEVESGNESFGRLWRAFMTARVTIASVLLVLQGSIYALGQAVTNGMIMLCMAYFAATLVVRIWSQPKPPGSTFDAQWISTVGIDVLAFSALNFL